MKWHAERGTAIGRNTNKWKRLYCGHFVDSLRHWCTSVNPTVLPLGLAYRETVPVLSSLNPQRDKAFAEYDNSVF